MFLTPYMPQNKNFSTISAHITNTPTMRESNIREMKKSGYMSAAIDVTRPVRLSM